MSDEYGVYFRPELALGTYRQARTMLAWRLGSMVLSIGLVASAWYAWPDQFGSWGPWLIGMSAISGIVGSLVSLIRLLRARRDVRLAQPGLAVGLNRDGMLIAQRWLPWSEVGEVRVVPGGMGGSAALVATGRDRSTSPRVPLDYTDTMPASLDAAVRVLSAGRAWVDLSRLD